MILFEAEGIAETIAEMNATWAFIGKTLAFLTVIIGLWKAVEFLWSKSPSYKLGSRLETAEKRLERGDKRFEEIDMRIKNIEQQVNSSQEQIKEVNKGIQMLGKAEISLINHLIDGNGIDAMRKEVKELTDYFIER